MDSNTGGRMKILLVVSSLFCVGLPEVHGQTVLPLATCKALGGKLLDCACDNFIDDINKIAAGLMTAFNSSDSSGEIVDIQRVIDQVMGPVFELILPTYEQMCNKMTTFNQCLTSQGLNSSTNIIDKVATSFVKPDRIDDLLGDLCALMSEIKAHRQCILNNIIGSVACVMIESSNFNFVIDLTKPGASDLLTDKMCPSIGSMTRCISIQFRTCGSKIRNDLEAMVTSSTTDNCKAKMKEGPQRVLHATPVECGLSATQFLSTQIVTANVTNLNITAIVSSILESGCKIAQTYLECIKSEIVASMNPMDIVLKAMVDFSRLDLVNKMIEPMCSNKSEQLKLAQCIADPTFESKIAQCPPPAALTQNENITDLFSLPADRLRGLLCTPVFEFVTCFLDILNETCNVDFVKESYAFSEILRLDCNGTRSMSLTTEAPPTQPSNVGDGSGGYVIMSNTLLFISCAIMTIVYLFTGLS